MLLATLARFLAFLLFLSDLCTSRPVKAEPYEDLRRALKNGSALAVDEKGKVLFEHRADTPRIPASALKIGTVACALAELGPNYRFETEFFTGPGDTLFVKGYGDPALVSEELDLMAARLGTALKRVGRVVLDDSFFEPGLVPDGQSETTNPYDAPAGALVANFNTANLGREGGRVVSAEPQTPLVPVALAAAARMKGNSERINIGRDRNRTLRYFGELLVAFLERNGVHASGAAIEPGIVPRGATKVYTHESSKTLAETSRGILEYSTNFSANQLFLILGARDLGPPANFGKGARAMKTCLSEIADWKHFEVLEGAGLSRQNRVSAREMVVLLDAFSPHKLLLPLEKGRYRAKTGSLKGVGTFAGYMDVPGRGEVRFAILINDAVPFQYKFKVADKLYAALGAKLSSRAATE